MTGIDGWSLLDHFGQLETALGVRQPVEIDAKSHGVELAQKPFDVEAGLSQHTVGNVDDPGPNTGLLEVTGNADEPDGIHLKYGRRRDDIAYGTVHNGPFAEVVVAGGVQQYQFRFAHQRILLNADAPKTHG